MTTFHPGGGGSSLTSADNSIPCHAELVSASHNKEIPKLVRDDKSHFPRPQGRGIKGEGLLHRPDCKILKRVQHEKNFLMNVVNLEIQVRGHLPSTIVNPSPAFVAHFVRTTAPSPSRGEGKDIPKKPPLP